MALTKVIGSGVGDLSTFTIDGSANDLMTFRTTGDSASQVLGLQFQNNSEAVTAQIFGTGDNSSSGVFRIKGIGSIELHGGDVAVSGDATNMLKIDANGHITMPNQTAFHARPASNRLNMGTGASIDMLFGTEVYDQNGDFDGQNGYVFTAPVTGKYLFTCMLVMFAVDKDYDYIETRIATSNRNYQNFIDPGTFAGDANYWTQTVTAVTDMDANDTCKIIFASTNGAEQLDISSMSTFTGALLC